MQVSFAGEAYETFQAVVQQMIDGIKERSDVYYMVRITPESGAKPFDAWLVGAAGPDSYWGDIVQVVRCKAEGEIEPQGQPEFIRVNDIHIY